MLITRIRAFLGDETGATAIEYGLLAMLIGIAIIGSFSILGNSLDSLFNNGTASVIANQTAILK